MSRDQYTIRTQQVINSGDYQWFDWIKSGEKIIEGRLNKENNKWLKYFENNDLIRIFKGEEISDDENPDLLVRILNIYTAEDFNDLYGTFGSDLIPDLKGRSPDDIYWNVYKDYYTEDEYLTKMDKYGVLGIEIEVVGLVWF